MSGCIFKTEPPPPVTADQPDDVLLKATEKLTEQLKQQKQLTADLQMKLLDKHAEVNRLTIINERLVSEFVRSKSKLRNRGDKAETVRLIAEVDTVITTVKESKPTGSHRDVLLRAEKYLAESKRELEKENVEGASYLANQALEQVREIRLTTGGNGQRVEGVEVDFLVPLIMKVVEASNVRTGPSLHEKVRFVLGPGNVVTAVGYQGQWVKVSIKGRGNGWIHYSLLYGARE